MLKKYYPYEYVESVFHVDYKKLKELGYKAIMFDLDNTLVPHGASSNPKVDKFFKYIHNMGFKTLLLSDNDEERVNRFIKNIDTLFICDAGKPNTKNFLKGVEMLGVNKKEVIYIGDQVFFDILGANESGIDNILVKYIGFYEEKKIGIRRKIERLILLTYKCRRKYKHRLNGIETKEVEL